MKSVVAAATFAYVASSLVSPPARADAGDYQAWLESHQIAIGGYAMNPSALPSLAADVCGRLRAGDSFENTARYASFFMDGAGVTRGAQETVCPDTLKSP